MEKKFYFLIILAFFIIVIGGIFLWSEYAKEAGEWTPGVEFEPSENYVFKDTPEGTIVENLSAGLRFNVHTPEGTIVENLSAGLRFNVLEGWTVDKEEIGIDEWIINVSSPDVEADEYGFLTKGCGISAWIEYDKIIADAVRYRMEDPERHSGEVSGGYEALEIGDHSALKMILENPEWGQSVAIKIPIEDRIYMFDTRFLPEETGRCSQVFEEFLQGISIF
jgi:hypothetical protein